jgi:hypothetical protein
MSIRKISIGTFLFVGLARFACADPTAEMLAAMRANEASAHEDTLKAREYYKAWREHQEELNKEARKEAEASRQEQSGGKQH